jgi:hypothetical protein
VLLVAERREEVSTEVRYASRVWRHSTPGGSFRGATREVPEARRRKCSRSWTPPSSNITTTFKICRRRAMSSCGKTNLSATRIKVRDHLVGYLLIVARGSLTHFAFIDCRAGDPRRLAEGFRDRSEEPLLSRARGPPDTGVRL